MCLRVRPSQTDAHGLFALQHQSGQRPAATFKTLRGASVFLAQQGDDTSRKYTRECLACYQQ
jgi:hypothetical protein